MRIAVALLGLTACFSPSPPEGLPCTPNSHCPDGQRCDLATQTCTTGAVGEPDAAVEPDAVPLDGTPAPDAGPGDTDGDTIPDTVDNCDNTPNPLQHDEDADDVGDVCDNCPHLANPGQVDTTETTPDGVGDACDPRPTAADQILLFDGFNGALDSAWSVVSGTWAVSGGALVQSSNSESQLIIRRATPTFADATVVTGVDLTSILPMNGGVSDFRSVGMVLRYVPGANLGTGHICTVGDILTSPTPSFVYVGPQTDNGAINAGTTQNLSMELAAGMHYDLRAVLNASVQQCFSLTPAPAVTASMTSAPSPSGGVALRTNGTTASYRYVIVIGP